MSERERERGGERGGGGGRGGRGGRVGGGVGGVGTGAGKMPAGRGSWAVIGGDGPLGDNADLNPLSGNRTSVGNG